MPQALKIRASTTTDMWLSLVLLMRGSVTARIKSWPSFSPPAPLAKQTEGAGIKKNQHYMHFCNVNIATYRHQNPADF